MLQGYCDEDIRNEEEECIFFEKVSGFLSIRSTVLNQKCSECVCVCVFLFL